MRTELGAMPIELTPEIEELRRFHAARREKQVAVTFEKSPVPMLWLDTSIFIDLAKIERGEALEQPRVKLLTTLKNLVLHLVYEGKLVCPEWHQSVEVEGGRLEEEIKSILSSFASGVRCVPHTGIKDHLMQLGMKSYLDASASLDSPGRVFFYDDPETRMKQVRESRYLIRTNFRKPGEWVQRTKDTKQSGSHGLRRDAAGKPS
jgi:hypothetical protein